MDLKRLADLPLESRDRHRSALIRSYKLAMLQKVTCCHRMDFKGHIIHQVLCDEHGNF